MKNKEIQRPRNMSQLDYLWTTYGSYKVSDEVDTENDSIPTSSAIRNYITSIGEGITELDSEEINGYKIKIIGKNPSGQEVSSIQIDSDTKISSFLRHVATQTDVDNGLANYVGEHWLVLKTNTGMEYWASVDDLFIRGQESDTIINQTEDGKISSSVKINNPIINKSVDLKTSTSGLWADLVINPNTKSRTIIVKGDNGIECKFNWEGTETPVALKSFDTFDEYQLTTIDPGTIYLVKDVKSIYFGGIKYSSVGIDPQDYYTKDEVYNKEQVDALPHVNAYSKLETDTLLDKKADVDDIPTALPNPNALVVKYNGEIAFTYDGSRAETGNFIVNADTVPGIDEKVKSISYTKEEVDSMITPHTNAYTKEESDAKYATKATTYTKEETYSKQEVDVLVSNPIDAYTKTESDQKYATKSELETKQNALVSGTNIKTFNGQSILGTGNIEFEQGKTITVVTELPQTGDPDRIYLVPNESSRTNDIYDEYIWLVATIKTNVKKDFQIEELESDEELLPTMADMTNLLRILITTTSLTDTQALTCKSLYPTWKSCIGSSLKAGDKVTHKGLLYKVKQTVNPVLENQAPGKETASLYEEINETHEGTKEDPIPYNGNMQLILGKYYSQDEVTYLCSRDSGQAVYNPLKDLVGIYVIVAE